MKPLVSPRSLPKSLAIIAATVGVLALAFAYTAGWLSPRRVTPARLVEALSGPTGPAVGHRRNHAKGICFTGLFASNGEGEQLSRALVFRQGEYPVVGRFNTGSPDPKSQDPMAQVRGFSTRITTPDGQEWRGAAIDAPFFVARTPEDFFALISAAGNRDPNAIKNYIASHPEFLSFVSWVKGHARTESWAEDRFNSLDSFVLVDPSGVRRTVRWSFIPEARPVSLSTDELAKRAPDFLESDIAQRVANGPQRWDLVLTLADRDDPTADPTKVWPLERRTVDVGTLVVQQIEPEPDGPCRDINFDPSVLPPGIATSDDPFPAARSAAYRVSYDSRIAEQSHYPRNPQGAKP